MPKFIAAFAGVTGQEIYPREFKVGEDCPDDLLAPATALGAIGKDDADSGLTVAEMKAVLDGKSIQYKSNASKAELAELIKAIPV